MIKVLYDHQTFSIQQYGGISRYFANLINGFEASAQIETRVALLYHKNHYLKQKNNFIAKPMLEAKPSRIPKWNKTYSKWLIEHSKYDLLHPTYYNPYFLKKVKTPYVLTVHDIIYELYPKSFLPTDRLPADKKITVKSADGLIAISESAKNDLIQILNVPEEKIRVIYHGIDTSQAPVPTVVAGLPKHYLLFVG